jgi:CBS domain-containing protein
LYEFLNAPRSYLLSFKNLRLAPQMHLCVRRLEQPGKGEITMTVREVMTAEVTTCRLDTNLAAASALLWENDCRALPVLNSAGEFVGVLTDRDICIALGTRNVRASELTAGQVIGGGAAVCSSTDDIGVALQTMRVAKIRRLPVVNEERRLEGIVSIDDVDFSESRDGDMVSLGDVLRAVQASQSIAA